MRDATTTRPPGKLSVPCSTKPSPDCAARTATPSACVVLLGISGTIAYQQIAGPGSKTRHVQVQPPAAPAPAPVLNWMAQLHAVYDLADGEVLKHVAAPFINDRLLYYQTYMNTT